MQVNVLVQRLRRQPTTEALALGTGSVLPRADAGWPALEAATILQNGALQSQKQTGQYPGAGPEGASANALRQVLIPGLAGKVY